jgi:hypothetical protein
MPTEKDAKSDRYLRTVQRKLGEDLDLAGKALAATGSAAVLTPLATKGTLAFPTPQVGAIVVAGLLAAVLGIHMQAKAKPDE